MSNSALVVLLVGNGGREHALAWKLNESPRIRRIYVAPGNAGTASLSPKIQNADIGVEEYEKLANFACDHGVDLAIPGPEVPLVNGVEKYFRRKGVYCFGPSQKAARMEGSKAFSKVFMKQHNIPTAAFESFQDYKQAKNYLNSVNHKVVIKASGLAAGKGVLIPENKEEAQQMLRSLMIEKSLGDSADEVVIEELLEGDELSILSFSDGYTIRSLPAAQDHKRIFDGDKGPNTGGMGCYAPAPLGTPALMKEIHDTVLQPTIDGMRRSGYPFVGLLFTGFMITTNGPRVLEYNVRFGDPETQTLLPLLSQQSDLADIFMACVQGRLDSVTFDCKKEFAVTVVLASEGYPGSYAKGHTIELKDCKDAIIFHAGTKMDNNSLKTSGGRVLAVTATAETLKKAVDRAYESIGAVTFTGAFYRKDIAFRALRAPSNQSLSLTYDQSGVSVSAGNEFVERIKSLVKSTRRPGADAEIGGFGGVFDLSIYGAADLQLVSAIDGVGTKLMVAHTVGKHNTVGIDLVAMNVNDLIVQGAEPIAFLDYYACGSLDLSAASDFVEGVAKGCIEAGCALVGGETAEMPGMYPKGSYDAAGTAIGVVTRGKMLPKKEAMKDGDILIALKSNGLHSNGFSLVRKVLESAGVGFTDRPVWRTDEPTVGEAILRPTRIYAKSMLACTNRDLIKGAAHITGGGLTENVPRMLPANLNAEIDGTQWKVPSVFQWMKHTGNIPVKDMLSTFNMGLGMVCVVSPENAEAAVTTFQSHGDEAMAIGRLVPNKSSDRNVCIVTNSDAMCK